MAARDKYTMFFSRSVFSQFYTCTFTVNDQKFISCEQYMMYSKALLFHDENIARKILQERNPKIIKKLGRQVHKFDEKIWKENRERIVKEGNKAKFTQNKDLQKELLSTKGTKLVETSPYDLIWGIGYSETDPEAFDETKWRGLNLLGKIISDVRDEILSENSIN